MPLQNRMLPSGKIVSQSWRGTFMGNRGGRIHDPETQTLLKRRSASRRWICCVLDFKNRQRKVMGEGYTELFFMDEVSALAAGHRPCFECRRKDAVEFQTKWQEAFSLNEKPGADLMDRHLHAERTGKRQSICSADISTLPNGAMILCDSAAYAIKDGSPLKWSSEGYSTAPIPSPDVEILTPPAILSVLSQGYRPVFHASANGEAH